VRTGRPAKYPSDPTGTTKRCTKCGAVRDLDGFYADAGGVLGRVSACKECCKKTARACSLKILASRAETAAVRECAGCKVVKPAAEFSPSKYAKSGLQSYCKTCRRPRRRWWQLKQAYGIDRTAYERMLAAQGGLCAICLDAPGATPKGVLFVDHCHKTGKVRGLLCESCNLGIGKLKDNPEVYKAIEERVRRELGMTREAETAAV